jgi:chromosome segregation ATPase
LSSTTVLPAQRRRKARIGIVTMAVVAGSLGLLAAHAAFAADENSVEARLRQALRAATAQQRALEDENATLRAKQGQNDRQVQDMKAQLADQTQALDKLRQDDAANVASINTLRGAAADLTGKLQASQQTLSQTEAALAKWKDAYNQAADVARTRDADAKLLQTKLDQTTQRAGDCETKNVKLIGIGNELLDLYQAKGPLTGLLEREPLTQIKRVELENLAQDYQDKLLDNKVSTKQH